MTLTFVIDACHVKGSHVLALSDRYYVGFKVTPTSLDENRKISPTDTIFYDDGAATIRPTLQVRKSVFPFYQRNRGEGGGGSTTLKFFMNENLPHICLKHIFSP